MRYAPPGFCLNDFDILKLGDLYHLFHLQGSRTYPFIASKMETSYGHAISSDLIIWKPKAPVFGVSDPPNFDDAAIWTMHIISHENKLWMFYTGLNQKIHFQQQIGLAISDRKDGTGWTRHSNNPIVSVDEQWYQVDGYMAWRDPFVVRDEKRRRWIMYIAAKEKVGSKKKRGCIATAISKDLIHWDIQPPLIAPKKYREMECPVIYRLNDSYYLLVSISDDYRVYAYQANDLQGPFEFVGILTQPYDYAPRLVQMENQILLLHTVKRKWGNIDTGPIVRGMLAQPKELLFDSNGKPFLAWYKPIEKYLEKESSLEGANGILFLNIPRKRDNNLIKVHLRSSGDSTEKQGLEINVEKNKLELKYIEEPQPLQTESIQESKSIHNLKVLLFNEYIEIYINDRYIISTFLYRHKKGQFQAWSDGKNVDFFFHKFKLF